MYSKLYELYFIYLILMYFIDILLHLIGFMIFKYIFVPSKQNKVVFILYDF